MATGNGDHPSVCVPVVASVVLAAVMIGGCAGPRASVMAMRDIPAEQQEHDRRECEAQAGHADVTKPVSHTLFGALAGTAVGLGLGLAVFLNAAPRNTDLTETAFYLAGAAAAGAGLGAVVGAAAGFSAGMGAAHDEYFTRYGECMRERGYAVFRERR